MGVERAGGVDEQSASPQTGPHVLHDAALQLPAFLHMLFAPLGYRPGILAEHALAGAWHVGEDDIEHEGAAAIVGRIVVGHDDVGVPKLLYVLCQDARPQLHRLVGEEQAARRQGGACRGALAAGCRAEVEHRDRLVDELAQHMVDEH